MFKEVFVLFVVALAFRGGDAHSYNLGDCPVVDPMSGFNMNRLLGIWYVIQKTSTASTCITYNFTKLPEPDEYEIEQTSQHFILGLTPLAHEYHYTGRLSVPDTAVPARMKVKFPLNIIGKASFTVFMTDYDNYAAIFTCQGLGIGHRRSATILSRTKTLDKVFVDKIRTRLASYNVDPFDLSIISQKNCPKHTNGTNGVNINIDDDTFSAQSIAGVVRKAGEKVGDGIEYVAGGSKRVYNSYTENNNNNQQGGKIQDAAEYVTDGSRRFYDNARGYVQQAGDKLQEGAEYVADGAKRMYSEVASGDRTQKNARYSNTDPSVTEWLP